ncbi:MAG TPA: hypothetical protein DDW52_28840 [Planctomycetaceae bacterium]|nr:hypothetical protein [Planctomycetaceae bacterium]
MELDSTDEKQPAKQNGDRPKHSHLRLDLPASQRDVELLRDEIRTLREGLTRQNALLHRRGNWFQPNLKTLFLLVTLVACWFAWLSLEQRRSERVSAAVEKAESLGATVGMGPSERLFTSLLPGSPASPPPVVVRLFGRDLLNDAQTLHKVRGSSAEEMKELVQATKQLDALKYIKINAVPLAMDDLEQMLELTELTHLDISRTRLEQGPWHGIADTPLKYIVAAHTLTDDQAASSFADCPSLMYLDLTRTSVTDAGLMELAKLPDLRFLRILRCPITLAAVQKFSKLKPECRIEYEPLVFSNGGGMNLLAIRSQRINLGPKLSQRAMRRIQTHMQYNRLPWGSW